MKCSINYAIWYCTTHRCSLNEQGQCPRWLKDQKQHVLKLVRKKVPKSKAKASQ